MCVCCRYAIQLWDETRPGIWENRAVYNYYADLWFELLILSLDFMHHLHMLVSDVIASQQTQNMSACLCVCVVHRATCHVWLCCSCGATSS